MTIIRFDSFQLIHQCLDAVKAYFFVKFISKLKVLRRQVCVAIAQIIQYVAEMGAISVDKVSTILIFLCIVSSAEHGSEHRVRVFAQCLQGGFEVLATNGETHYFREFLFY